MAPGTLWCAHQDARASPGMPKLGWRVHVSYMHRELNMIALWGLCFTHHRLLLLSSGKPYLAIVSHDSHRFVATSMAWSGACFLHHRLLRMSGIPYVAFWEQCSHRFVTRSWASAGLWARHHRRLRSCAKPYVACLPQVSHRRFSHLPIPPRFPSNFPAPVL